MYATQVEAYQKALKVTMSSREIESAVLTKAALKLKECQDNWDTQDRDVRLDEALRFNQLVWSIFQAELMKDDNPLPVQLRQDILGLSAFVDKRIFEVMAFPSPEKLNAIININLNLAAGLRESST
ncbi:MAG: flagellar biosynthesis regulator FlhF [Nitrospirae bacterium RBG_13_43_8]|nr:MAG: flagellar biosynthesis regulator FlhF [Nitrospirae bacterium RBG_13_43_8]